MPDVVLNLSNNTVQVVVEGSELVQPLVDAAVGAVASQIAADAATAQNAAETAAGLAGVTDIFDTRAAADAALSGVPADAHVIVMVDEGQDDRKTLYQKVSGAYVFVADLNKITDLDAPGELELGEGRPLGQPEGICTTTESGAGALTGNYRYAYCEGDGTGQTVLSPVSEPRTVSGKKILVTIPAPRRGTSQRLLYRTEAGGSVYKLLYALDGGDDFYRSFYLDNTADGSLGAPAPSTDTSSVRSISVTESVKTFRTHPTIGTGPGDLTVLTGDGGSGGGGAYSIDFYGPCLGRSRVGIVYQSRITGTAGRHFAAYWIDDTGLMGESAPAATLVAAINAKGNLSLTPLTLSDPSLSDGFSQALSVSATAPTAPTAAVVANQILVTGAGSAAYTQTALQARLSAGYTGSSATYGLRSENATAGTGASFGLQGQAQGAAARNIGVSGLANGATVNIGVFGSNDGVAANTVNMRSGIPGAAGAFSNGTSVGDILVGLDGITPVFWIENGGDLTVKNIGTNGKISLTNSGGGGVVELSANGGNDAKLKTTNNVPLKLGANGSDVVTISTGGSVGINEASPDYKLDVNGAFGFSPGASVTPVDNGDVVFELTSNTSLTVKAKGSDGTVRSVVLTLA